MADEKYDMDPQASACDASEVQVADDGACGEQDETGGEGQGAGEELQGICDEGCGGGCVQQSVAAQHESDDAHYADGHIEDIGQMKEPRVCVTYGFFCLLDAFFVPGVSAVLSDDASALRAMEVAFARYGKGVEVKVFFTVRAVS